MGFEVGGERQKYDWLTDVDIDGWYSMGSYLTICFRSYRWRHGYLGYMGEFSVAFRLGLDWFH